MSKINVQKNNIIMLKFAIMYINFESDFIPNSLNAKWYFYIIFKNNF